MLHSTLHLYLHNYYYTFAQSLRSLNLLDLSIPLFSFFSLFFFLIFYLSPLNTRPPLWLYTAAGGVGTDTDARSWPDDAAPGPNGC